MGFYVMLKKTNQVAQAVKVLRDGGIIVYPTEGVYGLGCDPFNETAVLWLLKIKRRRVDKGLILIAASWRQVKDLVTTDLKKCSIIKKTNAPTTWVFPASKKVPRWIRGKFHTVALRVTTHPMAKKLCQKFGGPIVSTSANVAKKPAVKKISQLDRKIIESVDFVVPSRTGVIGKPTRICDLITGKTLRY